MGSLTSREDQCPLMEPENQHSDLTFFSPSVFCQDSLTLLCSQKSVGSLDNVVYAGQSPGTESRMIDLEEPI